MAVKNVPKEARDGNPVTNDTMPVAPVAELVRSRSASLSPAERKLARVLLASYPIAGLESVARFAERAGVSPPTVTRFIGKLGLRGYPQFQELLRGEVQDRLSSPLVRYRDERRKRRSDSVLVDALEGARANLQETQELLSQRDFEEVVDLLADLRRRVLVIGGRVSGQLAHHCANQLHLLRPGISLGDAERSSPATALVDLRRGDLLIVFDYRRYQADTIESARLAAAQGCAVVVFTDPWLSPASNWAGQVLVTSVEAVGPFDSLVAATAAVEALVAALVGRLGKGGHARMQRLEALRSGAVAADSETTAGGGG